MIERDTDRKSGRLQEVTNQTHLCVSETSTLWGVDPHREK